MRKGQDYAKAVCGAALFSALLLPLGGCSKAGGSGAPPTADQAAAFRGAPPAPGEGKEIADATARAAEYRRAHPNEFPAESSALPAKKSE